LVRAKDWSATSLGARETWTQSAKTALSLCLNSRFPVILWLGPELVVIYNDACVPIFGTAQHPALLGAAGREAFEIWPTIGPLLNEALAGRPNSIENAQFFFARRLLLQETYVAFSNNPILAADGRTVEGVYCACNETTGKVIGEGRFSTLHQLDIRASEERTIEAACRDPADVLGENPLDVPFAAIYLAGADGRTARLVAGTRLPDDPSAFPAVYRLPGNPADLPAAFAEVGRTQATVEVSDFPSRVGAFPAPLWPDIVQTALVVPLAGPGHAVPAGFLVVGVNAGEKMRRQAGVKMPHAWMREGPPRGACAPFDIKPGVGCPSARSLVADAACSV
jgi:hypothetical protein